MTKNVAGDEFAALRARDAARMRPLVGAVAILVGLSLSLATPAVMAGTGSATAGVNATVGGLATGKPRLRFAITTHGGFPVTAVTVALPPGLAFSRKRADLDHGVRVGTDTPRTSVRKGRLTVTAHRASSNFVLTIAGSAMTESTSLEHAVMKLIHFNQSHMSNQRALPLTFTLTLESGAHATLRVRNTIAFR